MERRLVLATRNRKKRAELEAILAPLGLRVHTLDEFPEVPEVVEDGATFEANARKKARAVAEATGLVALADDSGLEVDALGGLPGVHSARFAGEPADDARNNQLLLERLRDVPPERRGARFRCVIAVAVPGGETFVAEGSCEGRIGCEPAGEGGFGYDPLFIVDGYGQTFAQLPPEVKHRISHRGRALAAAADILARLWPAEQ
ncbi:MAG: XTP/dITP diphosphatase [Syntrophomonadaceae bacterium]|nr:XTP/dITP diphosphatase [Syntrophomonadaceae bacterium]